MIDGPAPFRGRVADAAAASALERILESVGLAVEPGAVVQAFAAAGAAPEATGREQLDRVAAIGHELGLRTTVADANAEEARAVLAGRQPLVTTTPDGSRWWVFEAAGRGRVTVRSFAVESGDSSQVLTGTTVVAPGDFAAFLASSQLLSSFDAEGAAEGGEGGDPDSRSWTWLIAHPSTPNSAAVSGGATGKQLTPARRLFRLLAPERADLLAVVAFGITIGVLLLGTPIAVQSIVNSVALGGALQPLIVVALFLLLALGFAAALTAIQTWVVELLQRRIFVRAVADLAARLPRITRASYDTGFGPERVNRFFDVIVIQKSVAKLLIDVLGLALAVFVGLTVLGFYHPVLFVFDIVLVLAIGVIVLGPRRRGEKTAMAESSAKYEVAAWLEEIAASPEAFRSTGAEQWIVERADQVTRDWLEARTQHFRTLMTQIIGALSLQVIASVALLTIGGVLVIGGSLTLGQLVAAELIVSAVVASVAKLGKYLETWYDLLAAVAKVGYLLDAPIESGRGELPERSTQATGARLVARAVSWKSQVNQAELRDVDFEVAPGERLLITGLHGTARLAFIDLLWRMRSPDSGLLRLDGRDLRELAIDHLRRDVAIVSAVEVVHGTIRDNVRLRRPFVTNDDARAAIELVGLTETLAQFPEGLESVMHPYARLLSDDNRRRLMLARALAGGPRLLVIDTSGVGAGAQFRAALRRVLAAESGLSVILLSGDAQDWGICDRTLDLSSACSTLSKSAS